MFEKKKKGEKDDLKKADMESMSPMMKSAKMGVLKHLSDMASDSMGDKLKGLKKVSVASDSKEGLKKGIDVAQDIVEHGQIPGSSEEIDGGEASEPESEGGYEDLSPEAIESKIAELKALLESKKA